MRILCVLALAAACGSSKPAPSTTTTTSENTPASTGPLSEAEFKALHAAPTANQAALKGEAFDLKGTKAYVSLPAGKGPFPAIIVIHEWWGLNDNIKHWADRLASAGYAALDVDLYGGVVATTPDDAMAAMKAVDQQTALTT